MTTTAPPFRLRAGETDAQYITRMRTTYGTDWHALPICADPDCNRAPVAYVDRAGFCKPLYYCKRHRSRAEEAATVLRRCGYPHAVVVEFTCPPRKPLCCQ